MTVDAVPAWIGPLDVVWAHTADATDADLADGVERAVRRGAEVVLSAPARRPGGVGGCGPGAAGRAADPGAARGWTCRAALAVGLAVVAALELLPAPLDTGLDALADQLDAEAERNQPGHEPFMNPAKTLALRLDEHTPLLWGTDAAGHGRRRARAPPRWRRTPGWSRTPTTSAARLRRPACVRALDVAARGRDIFHDPFADDLGEPAPVPPRLVLLATDDEEPGQAALRRTGRVWPAADLLHPVEEVPRGTRARRAAARRGAGLPARRRRGLPRPGHPHDRTRLSTAP